MKNAVKIYVVILILPALVFGDVPKLFGAFIVEARLLKIETGQSSDEFHYEIVKVLRGEDDIKGSVFKILSGRNALSLLNPLVHDDLKIGDLFVTTVAYDENENIMSYIPMVYKDLQWSFPVGAKSEKHKILSSFSSFLDYYSSSDENEQNNLIKFAIKSGNPFIKRWGHYMNRKGKDPFFEDPFNW